MLKDNISDVKKGKIALKQKVAYDLYYKSDKKLHILEKLGFVETGDNKKQTFRPTALNKQALSGVNHNTS